MSDRESQRLRGRFHLPAWITPTTSDYRSRYSLQSDWGTLRELPSSGDALDYWHILWLKKFAIPRFADLGLMLALGFSLFQKPLYRARTSIAIQDLNRDFLTLKEDPTAINPAGSAESYFQTQLQILHSERWVGSSSRRRKTCPCCKPYLWPKGSAVGGFAAREDPSAELRAGGTNFSVDVKEILGRHVQRRSASRRRYLVCAGQHG